VSTDPQFPRAVEAFKRGDLGLALKLADQAGAATQLPEWHHLVGLIHCRQGNPAQGVEHLRIAVEAQPANAAFQVMLARALIDTANPAAVLRMEKPPSAPTTAELAVWHARAEAAAAVGNSSEAIEAWTVIARCGQEDPQTWINLGRSLLAVSRFGEAEAAYRQALKTSPHNISALHELGLVYERTGQVTQLGQLLESALQNGIGKDELGYLWAVWELRRGHPARARAYLIKSSPTQDPVRWYRLRAKIAEKEGDTGAAFDASIAMNLAIPGYDEWRARGHVYRQELRALAQTMTPEWGARFPCDGDSHRRAPAFLVGFPRSGTTLLDTFLMGHHSIAVLEEKEILRRAGEMLGPQSRLPNVSRIMLENSRKAYFDDLDQWVDASFGGVVVDKDPLNMLFAQLIQALFSGAPIIFAQRHPCDAVLSCFMQSFVPNLGMASFLDLHDSADLYDAAMSVWTAANSALPLKVHTVNGSPLDL
jgi:Flp pilus assembly protein TadD